MFDSYRNFMSGEIFVDNCRKNSLFSSVVKIADWNTKAIICSNEGFWGSKTIVRQVTNLSVLVNIASDTQQYNSLFASALQIIERDIELSFFFKRKLLETLVW